MFSRGRPEAEPASPGDRLRPVLVQGVGVALDVLLQVGPDVVRIDLDGGVRRLAALGAFDEDEGIALPDRVAGGHRDPKHRSARVGAKHVLHLHRFDHGDLLPAEDFVAFRDVDADDRALDRRGDSRGAFGAVRRHGRGAGIVHPFRLRGLRLLVVGEQGQGIGRVDAGAGEAAVTGAVFGGGGLAAGARIGGRDEAGPAAVGGRRRQIPGVVVQPACVEATGLEVRMGEDALEPGDVRRGSADAELVEGPGGPSDAGGEVLRGRVGDHLREQRVERGVRLVAGVAAAVDSHAGAARWFVGGEYAGRGPNIAVGVQGLKIDPGLDREAPRPAGVRVFEIEVRERLAAGHAQLSLHQVHSGHGFGHRVLDLEACVRFDEGEAAGAAVVSARAVAGIHQKLEGPETAVPGCAAQAERRVDDRLADFRPQVRRRRRFDHLLVPALGAALALAEVDQATGLVAEELDLDVAGAREEFLDVETAVAESAFGFGAAAFVRLVDVAGRGDDAGPAPAAAAERLDDHCSVLAEGGKELACFLQGGRVIRAPQHGHVRGARGRTRPALVAEQL